MLLRFTFENAFCFFTETSLSMVASSDSRHPEHVSKIKRIGAPSALRAAAIYGANGHGKTKLVDAIDLMKRLAIGSTEEDLESYLTPFLLKKSAQDTPTRLTVNYRVHEIDYEYGIVIQNYQIEEEWLFEKSSNKEALLFTRERAPRESDDEYSFTFGLKLSRSKSPSKKFSTIDYLNFVAAGTDVTTSFLSEAVKRKISRLAPCLHWFRHTLQIVKPDAMYTHLHEHAAADQKFLKFMSESICQSDTGISNIQLRKTDSWTDYLRKFPSADSQSIRDRLASIEDDEAIILNMGDESRIVLQRDGSDFSVLELVSLHNSESGPIEFDLKDESSGTKRLLDLYPILFNIAADEKVYIVDEIDRKLHPLLAYNFVNQFLCGNKGQLIYTTHNTHMLDLELLRRDEIWIVQKKDDGSSDLYSLNDFKIRPDLDVRKGYLQGRFGGIPFVGSAKTLGWC
jgi:AAA15 family ATPase/GTPase